MPRDIAENFPYSQADLSIDIEDVTIRQLKILKTFLCFHGSEFFHNDFITCQVVDNYKKLQGLQLQQS